jgi:hypothetical protein
MQSQANPFVQHVLQHRQMMLGEFNKVAAITQSMVPTCDDVIMSINAGNAQRALASAQNIKGMSMQLAQSVQFFQNTMAQRLEMANYMIQSMRSAVATQPGCTGMAPWQVNVTSNQSPGSPFVS